mgnify:CR=1 FL=1
MAYRDAYLSGNLKRMEELRKEVLDLDCQIAYLVGNLAHDETLSGMAKETMLATEPATAYREALKVNDEEFLTKSRGALVNYDILGAYFIAKRNNDYKLEIMVLEDIIKWEFAKA